MATRVLTPEQRHAKQFRDRWYKREHIRTGYKGDRVSVPDDVVRLETHVPCGNCGARGACRHRPWA